MKTYSKIHYYFAGIVAFFVVAGLVLLAGNTADAETLTGGNLTLDGGVISIGGDSATGGTLSLTAGSDVPLGNRSVSGGTLTAGVNPTQHSADVSDSSSSEVSTDSTSGGGGFWLRIKDLTVSPVTDTTAEISFRLTREAAVEFVYGSDGGEKVEIIFPDKKKEHSIILGNLIPNTQYEFSIRAIPRKRIKRVFGPYDFTTQVVEPETVIGQSSVSTVQEVQEKSVVQEQFIPDTFKQGDLFLQDEVLEDEQGIIQESNIGSFSEEDRPGFETQETSPAHKTFRWWPYLLIVLVIIGGYLIIRRRSKGN